MIAIAPPGAVSGWLLSTRGDVVHRADCDRKGRAKPWRVQAGWTLEQVLAVVSNSTFYRACTKCMVPDGGQLTQLELGQDLRDEGTAAALAAAGAAWRADVLAAIERLAARPEPFTADDVRALGVAEPASPNAWGSVFQQAGRQGLIHRVSERPSLRASVRGHRVAVWQGSQV